jgi:hypothetical protein
MNTIREVTEEPTKHEGSAAEAEGAILLAETLRTLLRWKVEIVRFKDTYYVVEKK